MALRTTIPSTWGTVNVSYLYVDASSPTPLNILSLTSLPVPASAVVMTLVYSSMSSSSSGGRS